MGKHEILPVEALARGRAVALGGVPDGLAALAVGDLARALKGRKDAGPVQLLVACREASRMMALDQALKFYAPDVDTLLFPAWDCQPYDRVSPNAQVLAQRMTTLARLSHIKGRERPTIVIATVNALLQRVPAREFLIANALSVAPGNRLDMGDLSRWAEINGFTRTATVRDAGEYAVRGGILDLFPPGLDQPIRFDFFGDTLETIRAFEPETQRSIGTLRSLDLVPLSELQLVTETMRRFRMAYVQQFGAAEKDDQLYEAVSEGRRYPGMEHWLPLFHDRLDTVFDYLPGVPVVLEDQAEASAAERLAQIADHYQARKAALEAGEPGNVYRPLPPDALYLSESEWRGRIEAHGLARMSPLAGPPSDTAFDLGGRAGRSFAAERAAEQNVFDAVAAHVRAIAGEGRNVLVAAWTDGSRERLGHVLAEHGLKGLGEAASFKTLAGAKPGSILLGTLPIEHGVETDAFAIVAEQDILGDRLVRARRKARNPADIIAEASSLSAGDLVVHVDHGIGRFVALQTIEVGGAPHDCLEIHYAGGTKLYLPVENLELLSRYGSDAGEVQLDRLGGGAWQARKARLKKRIREMAAELVKIAAARHLKPAPKVTWPPGLGDEFAARFPFEETEDQLTAIEATLADLGSGRPMDRLVCGDVGFGKTEVALRAAFAAAMSGLQVAVVVPTTLLARQHFRNFQARFQGLPVNVAMASRLVPSGELAKVKQGLTDGTVDIVVGTHALLGKAIRFKELGLVIVDEEQHFGVAHKERLKALRAEVHVLTLTATPIPRTLQLAMTGVREMSIIATPPIDRLAVRSFVTPFDPLIVREALLRERYRGGQAFYVCPRIEDLGEAATFLERQVPEVRFITAHGQMAPTDLEERMSAFCDGKYDVLLSTTIVESGLDIPTANTLVVHRADMFGLAQLYQLRGRVGRSKLRAYALFTLPAKKKITPQATRRLEVLQSLDGLGAGFQLASHDLDIRGAGNLLGEEQSGHIKEVGYELYQQMLEEAVAMLKAGVEDVADDRWSPQISVGTAITLPDTYVPDLHVRLGLYRRLADIEAREEVDAFAAELVDRFGPMPEAVRHLLAVVEIKALCRRANVERLEVGPKGAVLGFRNNEFADPAGLVTYIHRAGARAKVRSDHRIVFAGHWSTPEARLEAGRDVLQDLVGIVARAA